MDVTLLGTGRPQVSTPRSGPANLVRRGGSVPRLPGVTMQAGGPIGLA